MGAITATLTAVPNGTMIDLDAEGTLNWFRPATNFPAWMLNYLRAGPDIAPKDRSPPQTPTFDHPFEQWVGQSRPYYGGVRGSSVACKSYDETGRIPVGLAPRQHVGSGWVETMGCEPGLMGHTFANAKRLVFPEVPLSDGAAFSLIETVAPAYFVSAGSEVSSSNGRDGRAQLNVGLPGRLATFTADYYVHYMSGTAQSWSLESLGGSTTGVIYSASAHGPMVNNQLYRLRAVFPASTDTTVERFAMRAWSEYDASTSAQAKVCFGCVALRDGAAPP